MIAPERSRFMLAPSNAFWLLLNSATSIWSSVTVSGLYSFAIFDSVSPRLTAYESPCARGAAGAAARRRGRRGAAARAAGAAPARSGVIGSTGGVTAPGRIEQERVVAHDAARGPVHLDEQVEVRLADGRRRRHARYAVSFGPRSSETRVRDSTPWYCRLFWR